MMAQQKVEPALARRLEALTGVEASCCVSELREVAQTLRASPKFERALARVKALSDEKRLLALAILKRRAEACGCELQAALDLTHATVSHHMAVLCDAGLVTCERRGKWVYYQLHPDAHAIVP
jgi:ArsR family transcriptional regulator